MFLLPVDDMRKQFADDCFIANEVVVHNKNGSSIASLVNRFELV